ncbi:glyoxalase superfamily protein [Bradyrhizobium sp. Ai1a-2]|uniref:glyoxalase superfamily protein n=1 Tax=Bradyrhizobium sp. Ai1a-2 TaxID=196490 RepID=UPI000400FA3D|nr:glyoxalase superfamily protein [Bradyrhizobium sp. Ai1a-2]
MRDFRDAKAMAHTLRAHLAARGFNITVSQSLELIAELFGVPDWNTLAAEIRRGVHAAGADAPSPPRASARWPAGFTRELELTLHRAQAHAQERAHEFATLEHLLLALIDDADAAAALKANSIDLHALRESLATYIQKKLRALVMTGGERNSSPTVAFRRTVYRAAARAKGMKRETSGANVLAAMFLETDSPAVWLLREQGLTQQGVESFTSTATVTVRSESSVHSAVTQREG